MCVFWTSQTYKMAKVASKGMVCCTVYHSKYGALFMSGWYVFLAYHAHVSIRDCRAKRRCIPHQPWHNWHCARLATSSFAWPSAEPPFQCHPPGPVRVRSVWDSCITTHRKPLLNVVRPQGLSLPQWIHPSKSELCIYRPSSPSEATNDKHTGAIPRRALGHDPTCLSGWEK